MIDDELKGMVEKAVSLKEDWEAKSAPGNDCHISVEYQAAADYQKAVEKLLDALVSRIKKE